MPAAKASPEGSAPRRRAAAARVEARVARRSRLGDLIWLTLQVPGWRGAAPGQFALLHPEPSACFLPRAFSVAGQNGEEVSFLIAPIGAGTRELDGLAPGESVWVTGPLGNGFDLDALAARRQVPVVPQTPTATPAASSTTSVPPVGGGAPPARIVVVAGGVGAAPFPLLLDGLAARSAATVSEALILLGFREQAQAAGAEPLRAAAERAAAAGLPCRVKIATEDGSVGYGGLVIDLLAAEQRPGDRVVVCGPAAMCEAVWRVCGAVPGLSAWFSLETFMACGVGSCHGCAITLADGSLARVCHEGPVFSGPVIYGAALDEEAVS